MQERQGADSSSLPSFESVIRDIERRDAIDHDNMIPAQDAILVETDHLSVSQVLDSILQFIPQQERR
jgi:cytidylate kinase